MTQHCLCKSYTHAHWTTCTKWATLQLEPYPKSCMHTMWIKLWRCNALRFGLLSTLCCPKDETARGVQWPASVFWCYNTKINPTPENEGYLRKSVETCMCPIMNWNKYIGAQHQTASVRKLHIFSSFPFMKTYEHRYYSYHNLWFLVDMLIYKCIPILWRPSWICANLSDNGRLFKWFFQLYLIEHSLE